jgi:hypothetical protein
LLPRRYKEYKWIGRTNKVYKFQGDSHIELPCNEVTGEEGKKVAKLMSDAARTWWKSIVQDPDSLTKPVFYLGLSGWSVTNFLPDGAHERTPGRVTLLANGAHGFSSVGDRLCFATQVRVCCSCYAEHGSAAAAVVPTVLLACIS